MRILHFIDTLGAGGAERQLLYLIQNLYRARYELHILTTYDRFRHYEPELKRLGIPIYSLKHEDLHPWNRLRALNRYIQLIWQLQPDIVHGWLHYPNLIARVARPVCPPHHLITAIWSQYSARQLRSERYSSRLSEFRIVINTNTLSELNTTKKNNITTIPNAVSLDHFTNIDPPRSQLEFPSQIQFTALMVARIDPRKDHLTLLQALHRLRNKLPRNFKLILIGETTSSQTQRQIDTAITEYGLQPFITRLPPTTNIAPHYHACDVSILPSKSEGFPNVILESFAAGKPVIVSTAANNVAIVTHGINGWVFPTGDSHALADCLSQAWQTPAKERARMGKNAYAEAQNYGISEMVERYAHLYEHVYKRS